MNKRTLRHLVKRLHGLPAVLFLVLALVFGAIAILSLRSNNLRMIELKNAVFAADEQNGDVEAALRALRQHVYTHMNTDLAAGNNIRPPIQLKYRYERLVAAEKERIAIVNEKVYTEAQASCEQRFPSGFSGGGRVPCIQEYVDANGIKEQPITEDLYKFDFASPAWSPDLAGWSLVLAAVFGAMALVCFAADQIARYYLRHHH